MGKLVESTFMTLDGVISNPHHYGPPYWDDEHAAYSQKLFDPADAMLLGRATYEGFAEAWPSRSGDPFADRFNAMPKYVASRTLTDADMTWNATLLKGDVADAVAKLKADHNLVKYGTGEFSKTLLAHNLVDEFHFWIFPVVAGSGDRLFDGLDLTHLELLDSTRFKSGIVVNVFASKPA